MNKVQFFMFSGQGSQYYQMGKELYDNHDIFRTWMNRLDKIAERELGISIVQTIYNNDKRKNFSRLLLTHPAIFIIEVSLAKTLISEGVKPDYVVGCSLGEFTALAIAGVMDIEESLLCIINQAKIIENNCEKGGMLLIADKYNEFREIIKSDVEIAIINNYENYIISGYKEVIDSIEEKIIAKGLISLRVPVEYGFHSRAIDSVRDEIIQLYDNIIFKKPSINFISTSTNKEVNSHDSKYCWGILRNQIKISELIPSMLNSSRLNCSRLNFIDISPSGELANVVKRSDRNKKSFVYSFLSPYGNEFKRYKEMTSKLFSSD